MEFWKIDKEHLKQTGRVKKKREAFAELKLTSVDERADYEINPACILREYFKNPLTICSSASCSVRPRVISFII